MLRLIDDQLNKITMYKLVLWGLRILAVISLIFSLTGAIDLSVKSLLLSLSLLSVTCYLANKIFSKVWRVPTNVDSYAITLLILFFILPPASTDIRALEIVLAGIVAMASKFLLTYQNKVIFNPAAFAPFLLGLLGMLHASWWVGSSALWPLTLVFGLIVVRKIRRFSVLWPFVITALLVFGASAFMDGQNVTEELKFAITSSPLIFLGTIMLTEPSTMPARRNHQYIYGTLVGFLYAMPWNFGPLVIYPETALLLGNLYAFGVNPRYRLRLKLKEVQQISDRVYNYVFTPDRKASFVPGQYMEWTLAHDKVDGRGNSRTLSIASSPTEDTIQAGVKFYEPSSSFKKAMKSLKPGDILYAGQITGEFVLPSNINEKLVFIAGGIGITPYRSMLKYLIDIGEKRDIVMVYAVSDPSEIAYEDVLAEAEKSGVKMIGLLTGDNQDPQWQGSRGKLDGAFIAGQIPDYKERIIYISGPNGLVENMTEALRKAGAKKIKTDHFTGY